MLTKEAPVYFDLAVCIDVVLLNISLLTNSVVNITHIYIYIYVYLTNSLLYVVHLTNSLVYNDAITKFRHVHPPSTTVTCSLKSSLILSFYFLVSF